jgi:hypothetical protein
MRYVRPACCATAANGHVNIRAYKRDELAPPHRFPRAKAILRLYHPFALRGAITRGYCLAVRGITRLPMPTPNRWTSPEEL